MSNEPEQSIDKVIAAAVQARIEASVVAALSGDAVMGQYVAAALNQPIEVPSGGYNKVKTTYLRHTIDTAMRGAVKDAINEMLAQEVDQVRDEVRKALRRALPALADKLAGALTERAATAYGLSIDLRFPADDR